MTRRHLLEWLQDAVFRPTGFRRLLALVGWPFEESDE